MLTRLIFADLVFAAALVAQNASATISGEVCDAAYNPLPFVRVELTLQHRPHTHFSLRADDQGWFIFTALSHGLPPGTYELRVSAPTGFRPLAVKSIRLSPGERKLLPPLELEVEVLEQASESPT